MKKIRSTKHALVALHRYVGLAIGIFWLLQALSGLILAFRWELDDAVVNGERHPVEYVRIERRVEALLADKPGWGVHSVWTSGSESNRFDIILAQTTTGAEQIWRVGGDGGVLRASDPAKPLSSGIFYDTLTSFHTTLLMGNAGSTIISVSGLLLCSSILLGLGIAWPAKGKWRNSLVIPTRGNLRSKLWQWHRFFGLWLALPAIVMTASGAALTQSDMIGELIGIQPPSPPLATAGDRIVNEGKLRLAHVVSVAESRFPGATLSGVIFPTHEKPWYAVRLRQTEEPGRKFGKTTAFVNAHSGHLIAETDAVRSSLATRTVNYLYPLHTGQAFSLPGRIAALVIGLWLVLMILLGWMQFVQRMNHKATSRTVVAPRPTERNIQ